MVSKAISAAQDLVIVVPGPGGKIPSHFLEAWCIHRRPNDRPQPIKRTEEQEDKYDHKEASGDENNKDHKSPPCSPSVPLDIS